jgi:excisionase family DNA binding protein
MAPLEVAREVFTPEQAAAYLQVNRETIYRYIREGKLIASRLGRGYRVPRSSLELLLYATRARDDISLREYTPEQIDDFLRADELDERARAIVVRFAAANSLPQHR